VLPTPPRAPSARLAQLRAATDDDLWKLQASLRQRIKAAEQKLADELGCVPSESHKQANPALVALYAEYKAAKAELRHRGFDTAPSATDRVASFVALPEEPDALLVRQLGRLSPLIQRSDFFCVSGEHADAAAAVSGR
jgi:hypothetical protein